MNRQTTARNRSTVRLDASQGSAERFAEIRAPRSGFPAAWVRRDDTFVESAGTWTAVVVGGRPEDRRHVAALLETDPAIRVVGTYDDGTAAGSEAAARSADLLFVACGFRGLAAIAGLADFAHGRATTPEVIVVADNRRYALDAFELSASDYLVKPVREQRLVQALEHAKVRLRERRAARWAESVALSEARSDAPASTTPATEGEGPLRKVLAHLRGQTVFVDVGQIACIEAEDYHTRVHTAAESYLLRHSMSWFENRLPATQFVRIHRSYIVNIDQIVALKPWSGGSYDVFLVGGRQARLSAARKSDLERVIGQTF